MSGIPQIGEKQEKLVFVLPVWKDPVRPAIRQPPVRIIREPKRVVPRIIPLARQPAVLIVTPAPHMAQAVGQTHQPIRRVVAKSVCEIIPRRRNVPRSRTEPFTAT